MIVQNVIVNKTINTCLLHFYPPVFRDILEMTEAIKVKDAEAEAYISEIEVSYLTTFLPPSS